jgi:hypothetical protein
LQKNLSDDDQVVIKNVGFGLTGNFSCEATADAPLFSTAMAHTHLQVVGKFISKTKTVNVNFFMGLCQRYKVGLCTLEWMEFLGSKKVHLGIEF